MQKIKYLFLAIIAIASIWTVYDARQKALRFFVEDYSNKINLSYQFALKSTNNIADIFYRQYEESIGRMYNKYVEADDVDKLNVREKLLDAYISFYEDNKDLGLKQLHFHLANGDSFIRFHRPNRYGDNLFPFRESVKIANEKKIFVYGFEEGKIFNGFRYVYPVFYDGKHLGSFEISFDFSAIRREMVRYTNSNVMLALKKSVVKQKVFKGEQSNYQECCFNSNFLVEVNPNILESKQMEMQKDIHQNLKSTNKKMNQMNAFTEVMKKDSKLNLIHFMPVTNIKNEKVGYIIAIKEDIKAPVLHYFFFIKILAGALFLIVGLFYWNNKIEKLNLKLEKLNTQMGLESEMLEKLWVTDALTGQYNRVKTEHIMKNEFARAERYHIEFSILMLDIDKFKNVNDTYGHQIGDIVLIEFCKVISENIRSVDTLGRWGGEEFIVILPETEMTNALKAAENIRSLIEKTKFERVDQVTVSIGACSYHKNDTSIEDMIKRADDAVYRSKNTGRNKVSS